MPRTKQNNPKNLKGEFVFGCLRPKTTEKVDNL